MSETTPELDEAASQDTPPPAAASDADLRDQARMAWLESHAAGTPLTGADLGRLFGRTDRWGRKRQQEAKASLDLSAAEGDAHARPAPEGSADRPRSERVRERSQSPDLAARPPSGRTREASQAPRLDARRRPTNSENGLRGSRLAPVGTAMPLGETCPIDDRDQNAAPPGAMPSLVDAVGPAEPGMTGTEVPLAFRRITAAAVIVVALVAAAASYESPYVNPWLA